MDKKQIQYRCFVAFILISLFTTMGCRHNSFYQPSFYSDSEIDGFKKKDGVIKITYSTRAGLQTLFYFSPINSNLIKPKKLWILFGGINSLALDWHQWFSNFFVPDSGFLLIDYPGYGLNEGIPRAKSILDSSFAATRALAVHFDTSVDDLVQNSGLIGHSLGSGTLLQYAVHIKPDRIILVSPFTTMGELISHICGAFGGFFLNLINSESYDNVAQMEKLLTLEKPPDIFIIHGAEDKIIPSWMGQKLAQLDKEKIGYFEIKGRGHPGLIADQIRLIHSLMQMP